MIVLSITLALLLSLSLALNMYLVNKNLMLNDQRELLIDQIENSLDMLDSCYAEIAKSLEHPIVFDDPIVKQVVNSLINAKNVILAIANNIVVYGNDDADNLED